MYPVVSLILIKRGDIFCSNWSSKIVSSRNAGALFLHEATHSFGGGGGGGGGSVQKLLQLLRHVMQLLEMPALCETRIQQRLRQRLES
jgi:hypothetical protein